MSSAKQQLAVRIQTGTLVSHSAWNYISILVQMKSKGLKRISWCSLTSSTPVHPTKLSWSMQTETPSDKTKLRDAGTRLELSHAHTWGGRGLLSMGCSHCADVHPATCQGWLPFQHLKGMHVFSLIRDKLSRDLRFSMLHVTTVVWKVYSFFQCIIH